MWRAGCRVLIGVLRQLTAGGLPTARLLREGGAAYPAPGQAVPSLKVEGLLPILIPTFAAWLAGCGAGTTGVQVPIATGQTWQGFS